MSECSYEGPVIKAEEEKSYQVNRADDPKPFFELELTRAHGRICSDWGSPLQCAIALSVRRNNKPVSFAVLEHGVCAPRLFLWWTFEFHAALFQFLVRFIDIVASERHVHKGADPFFFSVRRKQNQARFGFWNS